MEQLSDSEDIKLIHKIEGINLDPTSSTGVRTIPAESSKAVIVFDLNETLCKRIHINDAPKQLIEGYTKLKRGYLYKRPYLSELLDYLANSRYWLMAVDTTMTEKNGKEIVNEIFEDYQNKLVFCKYGDPKDYQAGNTAKSVGLIRSKFLTESLQSVRVLIVDNSLSKVHQNKPDEYYLIPTFTVDHYMKDDNALFTLLTYLKYIEQINGAEI
jgi:hypothetical protein